jgi:arrestin-related trafficking adapter 3/6
MRLSRPDDSDPTKRRHFEISIDSPFHILSCRATQANIALPAYTSPGPAPGLADEYECGCPGAPLRRRNSPQSSFIPTLTSLRDRNNSTSSVDSVNRPGTLNRPLTFGSAPSPLTRPALAHVHEPNSSLQRPMHLLRNPSFNPPAFDDSDPPPPLVTPPPDYDRIVGGDPRGALADYFARLADEYSDDDEGIGRGRVDIPLTPGARVNRSMDARRDWIPLDQHVAQ